MKRSAIEVLRAKTRTGGSPNHIMFSNPSASKGKTHYIYLRIGRNIARKAGLRPGDQLKLEFDDETMDGWLIPSPEGNVLINGDQKIHAEDYPPLIFKMTWAEELPSIAVKTAVKDVIITSSQHLKFKFPPGTSFLALADGVHAEEESELYQEHKEMVERSGSGKRVSEVRREAKKKSVSNIVKTERRGGCRRAAPYGRRATDRKDC